MGKWTHLSLPAIAGKLCVSSVKPGSKVAVGGQEEGRVKLLQDVQASPDTNTPQAEADEDNNDRQGD